MSFGQGLNVTAIQLASAVGALANGGVLHPPRLVDARRRADGRWEPAPASQGRRVIDAQVAKQVLGMMEGVVRDDRGTARRAALRDVRVAGKTGTAQKLDPTTGRYSEDAVRAFREAIGLRPNGAVSDGLVRVLGRAIAAAAADDGQDG